MNNKQQPLVSVIMPVYNAGEFLRPALDSVFGQTYKNIEVIVVNDGSTDGSLKILREYAKEESRFKIINIKKNQGPAEAANLGIKKAKGDFVARMDADDLMPKRRIEKQVKYLLRHPDVMVLGGQVELLTRDGQPIVLKKFPEKHEDILKMAFVTMPIQQGAMMVNKSLLPKRFVWYRKSFKTSEDLDFLFRAFQYGRGANLAGTVLYYRQHGESISQAEDPKKIFKKAFEVRKKALFKLGSVLNPQFLLIYIQLYLQLFLITIMPSRLVYPLYYLWRGMIKSPRSQYGFLPILRHAKAYLV